MLCQNLENVILFINFYLYWSIKKKKNVNGKSTIIFSVFEVKI